MPYPVSTDEGGIKIKPEYMEKEKMYYCLHKEKLLLVFKDEQEFLNCYEIEDPEILQRVKQCNNPDDIEKALDDYLAKKDIKH